MLSETGAASTSSAEQSRNDDVDIKALKLVGEGKRHLLVGDAPTAVVSLQEACEILSTKYGEISDQCGDCYYNYGNALLEVGRMETGVLGNALDGVPDDSATEESGDEKESKDKEEDTDERKKIVAQVKDALEANYQQCEKKEGAAVTNGDAAQLNGEAPKLNGDAPNKVNGEAPKEAQTNGVGGEEAKMDVDADKENKEEEAAKDDAKETKEVKDACAGTTDAPEEPDDEEAESGESGDEGTGNETGEETKEEHPDDIPNFQLAWEMLELSRVIFGRKTDKENRLKVAQVHFKLGELGLETEQYAQSLEDFNKCLEIQKEHLEPSSRLIAGSHHNLGLAFMFDNKMEKALEHFTEAKKTIEHRITKLEKDVTEHETKKDDDYEEVVKKLKQEITELKEFIPDILAKIEDAKEGKGTSTGFGEPPTTIQVKRKTDGPVSDVSHLVKRKRTPEADGKEGEADTKKTKQNGAGDASQVNGSAETKEDTKKEAAMETS